MCEDGLTVAFATKQPLKLMIDTSYMHNARTIAERRVCESLKRNMRLKRETFSSECIV